MTLLTLFLSFLKIGAFTFGGGYAMLPLIRDEAIARGWLTDAELVDFMAVSESTPGPIAVNLATFVGCRVGGVAGAACATMGVVLPSFVVILLIAAFYEKYKKARFVQGVMTGLKPAVAAMIASAALSVGAAALFPAGFSAERLVSPAFLCALAIFIAATVCVFKKAHPILVICVSAALGIACGYAFGLPV